MKQLEQPRVTLQKLGLQESEVDTYLAMLGGARTAREVIQTTGRSRPTVYYAITALERRGLLSKTGLEDNAGWQIEPLSRLETILAQKQAELDDLRHEVDLFAQVVSKQPAGDHKPQISFYEGVAAVRNVIMEAVYCHSRHIDSLVPQQNFFWQLGEEFVTHYVATRNQLGVTTRNLWAEKIDAKVITDYYKKAEIRMMAPGFGGKFRTTIFMYDSSVLYISSLASGYALLVTSDEHYELMQTMYEAIWAGASPIDQ